MIDEVSRILTSTLDIDQVFDQFSAEVKKSVDFDRMVVHKIDLDAEVFAVQYVSGVVQPLRSKGDVRPLENTLTQKMLDAGQTIIQHDLADQPELGANKPLSNLGMRSAIRVPMYSQGEIIAS